MFMYFFSLALNMLMLGSSTLSTTSLGKLFQSLTILTKNEYLWQSILVDLVCNLYGWLALVFYSCKIQNGQYNLDHSYQKQSYNIRSVKEILLVFLMNSSLRFCTFLRMASPVVFDLVRCVTLFFGLLIFFTKCGSHNGHAYSKIGRTSDLYSNEKTSLFLLPTIRVIRPRILFALFTISSTCFDQLKSLDIITPKSL